MNSWYMYKKYNYRQHSKECMWRQREHFYVVFNVYDAVWMSYNYGF